MTEEEKRLVEYGTMAADRDNIVQAAHASGVSKRRIWALSGIARTTIDRIIAASPKSS